MITSAIGKMFLEAYNEEYGTHYDARTFFIEQFYPLFFDQNKQMMYVINSPFVQQLPSCRDCILGKKEFESTAERSERLNTFLNKVECNDADASIAVAYPSLEPTAKTSGQVTNIDFRISSDDVFLSWIGGALGICTEKGYTILFHKKEILLDVYKGWKYYRQALNETKMLDGNKINSWNGQWLAHYYDDREFEEDNPMASFSPYNTGDDGIIGIALLSWTKILIRIAKRFEDVNLLGYVYVLSKSNTTLGFIPFNLNQIRRPIHLYEKLFGIADGREAEPLWGKAFGFRTACTAGVIGIKAMEPKGLRDYVYSKGDKAPKQPKAPKNETETINFNVYKIWILAMLNNEDLWDKSQELAELLNEASTDKDKSISTKRKNLVETMLGASNKKQFIAAATEVIPFIGKTNEFKDIVKEVHSMPTDNVPYFLTLLRFQYKTL